MRSKIIILLMIGTAGVALNSCSSPMPTAEKLTSTMQRIKAAPIHYS